MLGVIPIFVLYTANNIVGLISCAIGYKAGVGKILKIVNTPLFKRILTIAIVTGMMAMGALSADYVSIKTSIEFVDEEAGVEFNLQDKLDAIMPNLLTFIFMATLVFLQMKGKKPTTMMLITVIIALVGAIVGIW